MLQQSDIETATSLTWKMKNLLELETLYLKQL